VWHHAHTTDLLHGARAPLVHFDSGADEGGSCSASTSVVIGLWVVDLCADLVKLGLGLAALAEHWDEGRGLSGGVGIHFTKAKD
jgi:hypothetical protein